MSLNNLYLVSNQQEKTEKVRKCLFEGLVGTYKLFGLRSCGTSELQKWRDADGPAIAKKLSFYYNYIPELSSLSLESYSLCSSHYTQILSTNQFYERLVGSTQESKRTRLEEDNSVVPVDSTIELNEARRLLEEKSQLVIELNDQIARMQQYIKNQKNEINELKIQLQRSQNNIIDIQDLYNGLYRDNKVLIEQWNLRFATQQKRIDAIVEIADEERVSLFDDISLLVQDNSRFFFF